MSEKTGYSLFGDQDGAGLSLIEKAERFRYANLEHLFPPPRVGDSRLLDLSVWFSVTVKRQFIGEMIIMGLP